MTQQLHLCQHLQHGLLQQTDSIPGLWCCSSSCLKQQQQQQQQQLFQEPGLQGAALDFVLMQAILPGAQRQQAHLSSHQLEIVGLMTEPLGMLCLTTVQLGMHCLWESLQELMQLAERQQQFVCQPAAMHGQFGRLPAVLWQAWASLAAAQCQTPPHDASYGWCCEAGLMHKALCLLS